MPNPFPLALRPASSTRGDDGQRRRVLRRHKMMATGLLLCATVIYLACRIAQAHTEAAFPGIGYVSAAAEAGMIGGLADWFAVTALFRRPLHLPIPHTAIIKNKKDQLGQSLGSFVGENFLNAELIVEKVRHAHIPDRIGHWAKEEKNAELVSREIGKLVGNSVEALDPAEAEKLLRTLIIDRMAEPEWSPPLGRAIEQLLDDGHGEPIVETIVAWIHKQARDSEPLIERLVGERAPSWAPHIVTELVADRVYRELVQWTCAVQDNPDHEARAAILRLCRKLADDLQHDPHTIARVEIWKQDILASPHVDHALALVWASASATLIDAARDPKSLLRQKITDYVRATGERLTHDPHLRSRVTARVQAITAFLANNYAADITGIISETIERWDADEASEKIELMVGKDLQYIRVNGTVVGALAGVVIYAIAQGVLFFVQ